MADSYLQELFAERIGGNKFGKDTTIYKFEKIKRAKRAAKAAHPDVELIDMGVGEPDDMAFPEVVAALAVEAGKLENRFYSDNGCMEFRIAVQKYMKELYGVDLLEVDDDYRPLVEGVIETPDDVKALRRFPEEDA